MLHSVLFVVSLIFISTLTNLPFKIYSTFVIEEKWGFNKTTRKTFICDLVKSFLISLVFTVILIPLMLWVVDAAGDKLVISLVIFTFIVIVVVNLLVPTVILPLFYKFTDLEDG
jgi:STE24 endopeptidase